MKLLAKTFHGLEEVLAKELTEIGAENIEKLNRAVSFEGDLAMVYRANLALRTALNVLIPVKTFTVENQQDFYEQVRAIEWKDYFKVRKTILVNATTNSEIFDHSHFLALRTKDAIADYFTDTAGRRPNVEKENPVVKEIIRYLKKYRIKSSVTKQFQSRLADANQQLYSNLLNKYPELTPTELKICALLRMNLSSKEIANLTNRSIRTIDFTRNNIRKKMNLDANENLQIFLMQF